MTTRRRRKVHQFIQHSDNCQLTKTGSVPITVVSVASDLFPLRLVIQFGQFSRLFSNCGTHRVCTRKLVATAAMRLDSA